MAKDIAKCVLPSSLRVRQTRERQRRGVMVLRVEVARAPLMRALRARGIGSERTDIVRGEGSVLVREIVAAALPS